MGIEEMACYSDSLISMRLITEQACKYHAYVVLIQDISDLLSSRNLHCLREENQGANFMTKLGASSNVDFSTHVTPPSDLLTLLRNDDMGTISSLSLGFFFSLFSCFSFLFV